MQIEWFFLLALIGVTTGAVSALINIAPSLIALPVFYFFLPLFNLSFDDHMLPLVATCLVAFIPTHLHAWIQSMKNREVDFQHLINYAPGLAMGGIIGAQLLSLVSFSVFNVFFSLLALVTILQIIFALRSVNYAGIHVNKLSYIPVGLGFGAVSLLAGTCGRVMGDVLQAVNKKNSSQKEGTVQGFIVFTSIAAMVGFIYPAQPFKYFDVSGFVGAMHLPSLLVLAISHWCFYWLCHNRGNELDKMVLCVCFILFLVCALFRMWI
jgi:uncharacterized membrane protein YfcA